MMEHIFREFANRGIDPFGREDPDAEDEWADDDDAYSSSSTDPIEITVLITDALGFEPNEIEVEVDRLARLTIDNEGPGPHDFTIDAIWVVGEPLSERDDLDIHVELDGGDTRVVEFSPQKADIYSFHCTVCDGNDIEMTGTLIVS